MGHDYDCTCTMCISNAVTVTPINGGLLDALAAARARIAKLEAALRDIVAASRDPYGPAYSAAVVGRLAAIASEALGKA